MRKQLNILITYDKKLLAQKMEQQVEVLPRPPVYEDWSLDIFPHIKPREMRQPTYNPYQGRQRWDQNTKMTR